jgi:hypothetical protein
VPTPVPPNDYPPVFLVGSDRVIVSSPDTGASYVVRDGKPPTDLPVVLQNGAFLIPGPDQRHMWTNQRVGDPNGLALATLDGKPTGVTIDVPNYGGVQGPDGAGYVLLASIGGIYEARPGKVRRITSGTLRASGPTRWLTIECDDSLSCANVVIDRATRARHRLNTPPDAADSNSGIISPDGKTAALMLPPDGVSGNGIQLLDLDSGVAEPVNVTTSTTGYPLGPQWAWSPDSRWLFVTDTDGQVMIVSRATGQATPLGARTAPATQLALRHSTN